MAMLKLSRIDGEGHPDAIIQFQILSFPLAFEERAIHNLEQLIEALEQWKKEEAERQYPRNYKISEISDEAVAERKAIDKLFGKQKTEALNNFKAKHCEFKKEGN
jgi:hypothetical protein